MASVTEDTLLKLNKGYIGMEGQYFNGSMNSCNLVLWIKYLLQKEVIFSSPYPGMILKYSERSLSVRSDMYLGKRKKDQKENISTWLLAYNSFS